MGSRLLQTIKLGLVSLVMAAGLVGAASSPALAQGASGQAGQAVCEGINAGGGSCADDGGGLTNVVKLIVNILSLVAGIAAVIMIIVGGLRYITSGGDSSKIAGAKNAILYAIVGLVVVALAQFVVRFVLDNATRP
jgi:hypothetical protein